MTGSNKNLSANGEADNTISLEQRLEAAHRMETFGIMACGLIHDINNALAVMLGQAQLLSGRMSDPEVMDNRIEHIINAGRRASALTSQLLSVASPHTAPSQSMRLAPLLRQFLRLFERTSGVNLSVSLSIEDDALAAEIPSSDFYQVLSNLCLNAAQAMPEGGQLDIRLYAEVGEVDAVAPEYPQADSPRWVVLTVEDTGGGLPNEMKDHAFEAFFTTKKSGTGLGLTVVKRLVEQYGGGIAAQSLSDGRSGTQFKIWLPATLASPPEEIAERESPYGQGEKILVVDMDETVSDMLQLALRHHNYSVAALTTPLDVLTVLCEVNETPDLLLFDVTTAEAATLQRVGEIRNLWPNIAIILLSAQGQTAAIAECLAMGVVSGFIAKPFMVEDLLATLHAALTAPAISQTDFARNPRPQA